MNKIGICVICRVKLQAEDEQRNIQNCPQCKKTYFLKSEIVDFDEQAEFVHEDLQIELSGTASITDGGLLVSSTHAMDDFILPSQTKEDEYEKKLKKQLGGHVSISTNTDSR